MLAALDRVSLHGSRTDAVTAILRRFLAQESAEQRRQLKEALRTRQHTICTDRWPAGRGPIIETGGERTHTDAYEPVAKVTAERRQRGQIDLPRSDYAEAGGRVAVHVRRNQEGC